MCFWLVDCPTTNLHDTSQFRAAVSAEQSNIVHAIKSCTGIIFASLKLDPTLFSSQTDTWKRDNPDLLRLLKKNDEGEYIRLAPILFARPDAMVADEFLKNLVLVQVSTVVIWKMAHWLSFQIVRVEMYGKKILSGKTKGQKARWQRCNVQCVTEGLIAGAAIMVSALFYIDILLLMTLFQRHIFCWHTILSSRRLAQKRRSIIKRNTTFTLSAYSSVLHGPAASSTTSTRRCLTSPLQVSQQLQILLPLLLRPKLRKTISWMNLMLPLKLLQHSHPSQLPWQSSTSSPTTVLPYWSTKVNLHLQLRSCS